LGTAGKRLKKSYLIGICGGSASGKTTVAKRIIEKLEMPWVTVSITVVRVGNRDGL
jgi:uridine kinase